VTLGRADASRSGCGDGVVSVFAYVWYDCACICVQAVTPDKADDRAVCQTQCVQLVQDKSNIAVHRRHRGEVGPPELQGERVWHKPVPGI